jgi:RNA polymerase sigma-70 factor (ECF subfamily)
VDLRIEEVFRAEHGRILATLIRLLGDMDVAEEALQDAFAVALEQWPEAGPPANPVAWLVSTGRHKAIDRLRRGARLAQKREEIARHLELSAPLSDQDEETPVPEDRLRLIFTCCHPALATEAQVALTLRTLGGLSTDEIARAFLVPAPTMAQRLVRAKAKIRDAGIPYQVPPTEALAERLDAVLVVVYLVFNEGYSASFGQRLIRNELTEQAIRLGRMLVELLPAHAEPKGLLALMLLHDSRRATRLDGTGDIVLLAEQDRTRWDRAQIEEGAGLVEAALRESGRPPGPYALQAAIAAVHDVAERADETDWAEIFALYGLLQRVTDNPMVTLSRAVAAAMTKGPAAGLALLEPLDADARIAGHYRLDAVRAHLLELSGDAPSAIAHYRAAAGKTQSTPERDYLNAKILRLVGVGNKDAKDI